MRDIDRHQSTLYGCHNTTVIGLWEYEELTKQGCTKKQKGVGLGLIRTDDFLKQGCYVFGHGQCLRREYSATELRA